MIGINPARIGTSAAGRRIDAAGRAYERQQAMMRRQVVQPLPVEEEQPAPPPRAALSPFAGPMLRIIAAVAEKHGLTAHDIIGPSRLRKLVKPRQEAMYRCLVETHRSTSEIGLIFHRDHTTIGYGACRHALVNGLPAPRDLMWVAAKKVRHG